MLPRFSTALLAAVPFITTVTSFAIVPDARVFSKTPNRSTQAAIRPVLDEVVGHPNDDPLPVVIWHGLGDSADAGGLADIAELIQEVNPGTYVHIISVADNGGDRQASWFGAVPAQVEYVCDQLANDPILSTAPAIDAIGFSQGGQFLRAYVQTCGSWAPKIRNLITFGSQHNGISEFQQCKSITDLICNGANALLKSNAVWSDFIQKKVVPAQYYRDPKDYDAYIEHSNFLADINNERKVKNATYAKNLAQLEKFVMVVFDEDTTVIPPETGWFDEVVDGPKEGSKMVIKLRDRQVYKEDWLGLKALDLKGGLIFDQVHGRHMELKDKDLKRLFNSYLGPVASKREQLVTEGDPEL